MHDTEGRADPEFGAAPSQEADRLLTEHPPAKDQKGELRSLLQSWMNEGDAEEQRETGGSLLRSLDEDRLSDRKLFPPELKGVTW